jgi:hypothetical protein
MGIESPRVSPFMNGGEDTLKSILFSSLAELESVVCAVTLANSVCKSPGDAVQAIKTGVAEEMLGIFPRLIVLTIDSPAVGEPRCINETEATPPTEPELETTILAT